MTKNTSSRDACVGTPLGSFIVECGPRGVTAIRPAPAGARPARGSGDAAKCAKQIREFLEGKRRTFSFRMDPRGTAFQRRVWKELRRVGYGKTRSYADIARAIGRPAALRAVGGAVGANPLCVAVPCHRIVPSGGGLSGYAWGPRMKRKLLLLERAGAA